MWGEIKIANLGQFTRLLQTPDTNQQAPAVLLQVRVPYRVVGLVVGPKGATIKRIQQQTHTYIVTPSRDKEPVFEVRCVCHVFPVTLPHYRSLA